MLRLGNNGILLMFRLGRISLGVKRQKLEADCSPHLGKAIPLQAWTDL
jgi:hypothetical protein